MNSADPSPLILYVPGLLPKPEAEVHKQALFRCLVEGVRRVDPTTAEEILRTEHSFDVVAWTFDFYHEHRDFSSDAAAIDAMFEHSGASTEDIDQASSWQRRLTRWLYRLGDRLPFLIPHLATERMELHLRDLRRYVRDSNGIAEHTRTMLKMPLRAAAKLQRPILLVGHSMGSVIAYDALWQLDHDERDHLIVDLFLTMGSPLGQRYIQRRIKGHGREIAERYPKNIRRWVNLSAVGDLTAIDPTVADDFAEMTARGLTESIEDFAIFNYFRLRGELNVHAEYGYLINEVTARVISKWWKVADARLTYTEN